MRPFLHHTLLSENDTMPTELARLIKDKFVEALAVLTEDPSTEYLFLVGVDRPSQKHELDWARMQFSAEQGPNHAAFILP